MKAVLLETPAPIETHPLRVQDVPTPQPGPGELLALAAAGKVKVVVETFPLAHAEEALGRLKRGEVRARAVLLA
ncbi:MAG: hypothetical protein L0Y66_20910 [Myxococcaceae bacterium]|nr:hypothetical protein [Myxococcaceae bacterium]